MIDNTSCINAINTLKNYVTACFNKCTTKGSTYTGIKSLANLETAIDLIPSGNSGNVTGASFSPFKVTYASEIEDEWGDYIFPDEFTIDFGAVGVGWKSILCYSDTKDGHFSIQKLPNNKCIISSAVFYDGSNMWDEAYGVFPRERNTYRATYQIHGNSITFTNAEYNNTSNGIEGSPTTFRNMPYQVSDETNDYYTNQYKLDKITVCV